MLKGQSPNEPIDVRFARYVKRGAADTCWTWTGRRNEFGYGTFSVRGKSRGAHRVALALSMGVDINALGDQCVLHSCDNPSCVNPAHLRLGTPADNAADRDARSRRKAPRGAEHWKARLTEDDIRQIRAAYKPRYGALADLGREYGVTNAMILRIVKRQAWRHVA